MDQGIQLTTVTLLTEQQEGARIRGRAKLSNLAVFSRQFSAMVDAGVPLVRGLDVMSRQTQDKVLQKILVNLGQRIQAGDSLSHAMQLHPNTFSNLFVGLIRAGEVGGVLDKVLQRLATFLEKEVELRRKVKAALTYPVLVLVASVAIVLFLVSWVVPQFAKLFQDLGLKHQEFPKLTQILIDLANGLTNNWVIILASFILFVLLVRVFMGTPTGRRVMDSIKLRVPVFGDLHKKVCMARFSRTLGTLLGSGVPILQAMETVAGTVGNVVIADAILEARTRIRQGESIAEPLANSGLFPPMVVHMISVGEESGALDAMLQKIADFYDTEIDGALESLTAALEPFMIIVLGGIVGFIVIAMFLPGIQVMQELTQGRME
jgi:type IV pilus assembly protein PilC